MKISIIKGLDETISAIKLKDNIAEFGRSTVDQFEFYLLLSLEIARFEIINSGTLSDKTASALNRLFTFQVFEYYYKDYPELYEKCSNLGHELRSYNENWKNHTLAANLKSKDNWIKFFCDNITKMIQENGFYSD